MHCVETALSSEEWDAPRARNLSAEQAGSHFDPALTKVFMGARLIKILLIAPTEEKPLYTASIS